MSSFAQPTFSPTVIAAVLAHMNSDHNDHNLVIARAFGAADAASARMVSLDHRGGTWSYTAAGMDRELTLAWSREISERFDIRQEIVARYDAACVTLGIAPRPH